MFKKLFFLIILFFLIPLLWNRVEAQGTDELVPEPTCIAYTTSGGFRNPVCNKTCARSCVTGGKSCEFGQPSVCKTLDPASLWPEVPKKVRPAFNLFSIELCPDPAQRPPDDPYCMMTIVRLGVYAVISFLIFVQVIIAFWVVWERSTASDNTEKIEKASSIAKNAVLGALITFLFIAIVQVTALVVGLTGSLFDISIVPQPRVIGHSKQCSGVGYVVCEPGYVCRSPGGTDIRYCLLPAP